MDIREAVALLADGGPVRMSGGSWSLRCPAHDDGKASLSVSPGREHPIVLHCLAGDTRVITREGTTEIAHLAGGVHELLVPAVGGGPAQWQKCPVEAFGVQRLWRITLRRHSATKVIHATAEHRWFTQLRGSSPKTEVTTAGLRTGDRLAPIIPRRTVRTVSSFGVAHGFVFGDGSVSARGVECTAQFCGPKDDALLPYFPQMQVRQYGEGVKRISGLPRFFKDTPSIGESPAYLLGWLAGYFAADGSVEGHCAVISSASRDALEFVRDVCTRLGIVTYPIRHQSRQGYGTDRSDLFKVTLRGADLWSEFFVLPSHRAKWDGGQSEHSREAWIVESVALTDREEQVFCATVEGSHAFALEDFILTGNCHAGCTPDAIAAARGLSWADLCAPKQDSDRPSTDETWTPAGPAVAVYDYRDERGELLFQVCRTAKKDFLQRRPDPAGRYGWVWKLGETRRVLYRLGRVIEAVEQCREIYIAEGEKDVHTLEAQGLVATCNPGGAGNGKWKPEYSEVLRDAVVIIVADNDAPGQAHARLIREALTDIAASITVAEAASGKDATDHFAAGHTLDDLLIVWPRPEPKPILAADLWEFLAEADEEPEWLIPGLLERGDRLILTGFEGQGKSMLVRQIAICAAAGIHPFRHERRFSPIRVLMIDCENSRAQSRRKFRPLAEATKNFQQPVPDHMMYPIIRPEGMDLTTTEDAEWLLDRVTAHKPDMLIIGPFYRLYAGNMNDELLARRVVSVLDKARAITNCALITEAHAGHGDQSKGHRSVRPTGSSLLLRWPEFGYGLSPNELAEPDEHGRCREMDFLSWRGARDERDWPQHLRYGRIGEMPWQQYKPQALPKLEKGTKK